MESSNLLRSSSFIISSLSLGGFFSATNYYYCISEYTARHPSPNKCLPLCRCCVAHIGFDCIADFSFMHSIANFLNECAMDSHFASCSRIFLACLFPSNKNYYRWRPHWEPLNVEKMQRKFLKQIFHPSDKPDEFMKESNIIERVIFVSDFKSAHDNNKPLWFQYIIGNRVSPLPEIQSENAFHEFSVSKFFNYISPCTWTWLDQISLKVLCLFSFPQKFTQRDCFARRLDYHRQWWQKLTRWWKAIWILAKYLQWMLGLSPK